jgi:hypothetical protein
MFGKLFLIFDKKERKGGKDGHYYQVLRSVYKTQVKRWGERLIFIKSHQNKLD